MKIFSMLFVVLCTLFVFCSSKPKAQLAKSVETFYNLDVGVFNREVNLRYLGMPSQSTFAIDRLPGYHVSVPVYYPVGIDTIHDGSKSYLVKDVQPKFLRVLRIK